MESEKSSIVYMQVIQELSKYVTDHKKLFVENVLSQRTRFVTLVMEDIYQTQNASAVLRTVECFGLQDIHIVENEGAYTLNKRVLKGADKWLTINQYRRASSNNTKVCFEKLKEEGYTILAAVPSHEAISIQDYKIENKVAVVIGNELHGLSAYAKEKADQLVRIPMYGFTESLNLSVSAAICLNELIPQLRGSKLNWQLLEAEKSALRLDWYRKIVKGSAIIEKQFLKSIK